MAASPSDTVRLTELEMELGRIVGVARHKKAIEDGKKDRSLANAHGMDKEGLHILGARGELACAKSFGCYYFPSNGQYADGADIGSSIQVRTRRAHWHELCITEDDLTKKGYGEHLFVLVTNEGNEFRMQGCLRGKDARLKRYWGNLKPGWPSSYIIPQEVLKGFHWAKAEVTLNERQDYGPVHHKNIERGAGLKYD